ncbi:MAG TPA: hypothetical protein PK239_18730 [Chitinophagales bacterium]|nr:hypothetical protein [Chitinophagales bacterium]
MRWFLSIFIAALIAACQNPATTHTAQPPADTLTIGFLQKICNTHKTNEQQLVVVVNPSFCGSCTEKVKQFLQTLSPLACPKCFILSSSDSTVIRIAHNALNSNTLTLLPDSLARYNLLSPYSSVYLFQNNDLVYHTPLIEENLTQIYRYFLSKQYCSANP